MKKNALTFAILDEQKGFAKLSAATEEEFPLPAWYRLVSDTLLDELGLEDVCKACRQQIHLEHIVPRALRILKAKPLVGEMYDGELLVALKSIPSEYWRAHVDEVLSLESVIESVCRNENLEDDLHRDVRELLTKIH